MLNERKFKIHSSIEADIGINEYYNGQFYCGILFLTPTEARQIANDLLKEADKHEEYLKSLEGWC